MLSDAAIENLRRLWVSPKREHILLAITMSNDPTLLRDELLPECILAKEFHPDLTTRLDIEDFLNKNVYGLELREWRERIKFFQPPHQVFLYTKYKAYEDIFESYFLDVPHIYEKYKKTAIDCSYDPRRADKLRIALELLERILEKEPEDGDNYFFLARCHHYLYLMDEEYGSTRAIKAYRKAMRNKTTQRQVILRELDSLVE